MFRIFLIFAGFSLHATLQLPPTFTIDAPTNEIYQTLFAVKRESEELANLFRIVQPEKSYIYYLFTEDCHLAATAKAAHSSDSKIVLFELFDADKRMIGTVEEVWTNTSFLKKSAARPYLQLYSEERKLVAKAQYAQSNQTITLSDPETRQEFAVASLQEGSRIYNLQWNEGIDSRLFLLLVCIAADAPLYHKGMNVP